MRVGLSRSLILLAGAFFLVSCSGNQELVKTTERQRQVIMSLTSEVDRLSHELEMTRSAKSSLEKTQSQLERKLKKQMDKGDVDIEMKSEGLVVTLFNQILFDSGKTKVKEEAYRTLNTISDAILSLDENQVIRVEGHTDNVPIKHSGFKSNWELSTTRATEVLHVILEKGVGADKLVAVGYGENRPVASNETAEGRARNRRVEIIFAPKIGI